MITVVTISDKFPGLRSQPPPRPTPVEIARRCDQLLRTLARSSVLVGRALGKGLVRLAQMDGFSSLGYRSLGNFASQELGMSGRAAQELAWMERRLERYPATRDGFERGSLSYSHVVRLLRAIPVDDEARWADAAARMTVAELELALEDLRKAGQSAPCAAEEINGYPVHAPEPEPAPPHRIEMAAMPTVLLKLDLAVDLVRFMHGGDLSVGQCLEAVMAEYLSGEGYSILAGLGADEEFSDTLPGEVLPWRSPDIGAKRRLWRDIEIGLAEFTDHWAHLNWQTPPVPAPESTLEGDARGVTARMRRVVAWERQQEIHLMKLLAMMADDRLYEFLDFANFPQYARDRLAMSPRAAWALVTLDRRMRKLPAVRHAHAQGRLTNLQADLVAKVAAEKTQERWIQHASTTTLKLLRQDVEIALRIRAVDAAEFARTGGLPAESDAGIAADIAVSGDSRLGETGGLAVERGARVATDTPADGRLGETRPAPGHAGTRNARSNSKACGTPSEPRPSAPGSPVQMCAPADVAKLPVRERLKLFRSGDLDEIEPGPQVRVRFMLPDELAEMWRDVWRACVAEYGNWISVADALEVCLEAFLETWAADALAELRRHPIFARDAYVCSNPTCTARGNLHEHHVNFRSRGGSDDEANLTTVCLKCHLRLIHLGRVKVTGSAPDGLLWELGIGSDGSAHLCVVGRRIVKGTQPP